MKKMRSLRSVFAWIIVCAFLLCEVLFIGIFYPSMLSLLSAAENQHLTELGHALEGSLNAQLKSMNSNTRAWSSWDTVYDFVMGAENGFVENDLDNGAMLPLYDADYVIIKDLAGNDVLAMPSNLMMDSYIEKNGQAPADWAMALPQGLSARVTPIAAAVLNGQATISEAELLEKGPYCDTGFVVVDGESYMICVMPVIHSDETGDSVGTFAFLAHFGNREINAIANMANTTFTVLETASAQTGATSIQIHETDVVFNAPMPNLRAGRDVTLSINHHRLIYTSGMRLVLIMLLLITLALALLFGLLFQVINRRLLRSIGALVTDVENISGSEQLDTRKYNAFKETYSLSTAINDMSRRVEEVTRVENETKASVNILESIMNGMDAYLYVSDPITSELLFINDKMKAHFGIRSKGVGQVCWRVLQTGLKERCDFCPCHQLHTPEDVVVWEEHNTVTKRFYRNTDRLITWADGRLVHLQHSVDITDIKDTEAELIAAKELAEQGSQAKGEFLSRMSHEMRTPMNAIIGMTNIAHTTKDAEKKEYCLDRIDNASKHLLGVINDILDMSKIEANKFELSPTEFNLDDMLMNVLNVVNFRIEEKQQHLSMYIDPQVSPVLYGDQQRLNQVVTNLLTNAVKFTPNEGNISLNVNRVASDSQKEEVLRFEVADTGIGISEEQQSRLFTSFEQADGSTSRKFGGTGLGLAISKKIVELMGGRIWVESELDNGSKFIFTIKMKPVAENKFDRERLCISKKELSILVVDDSAETCDYFACLMENLGIHCECAYDGVEALKLINEEKKHFDMIFVDWQMPNMDGVELTRSLRNVDGSQPVIVMISVAEWSDIKAEALNAGVDAFVPKPLFPSKVTDCIHRFVNVTESVKPKRVKDETLHFSDKTILLAEDIDINREIVLAVLEDTQVNIVCAENGLEAVEKFTQAPELYDLIYMDVHMPLMDGMEATRQIRASGVPCAKTVPIVAMTANVFKEDVDQCLASGMDSHIGKPINFEELLAMTAHYLSKK